MLIVKTLVSTKFYNFDQASVYVKSVAVLCQAPCMNEEDPGKSFYIWQCMVPQSFGYYLQILTPLFSSIFLEICNSPMILCFVYCIST